MGEAELNKQSHQLIIRSEFIFYGDAATPSIAQQIADDIALHWNEPCAVTRINYRSFDVRFEISGICHYDLDPEAV